MPDDYAALLQRARKNMKATTSTGERFVMPPAEIMYEGKTTIVKNMEELLDKMNRKADQVVPLILREIGSAGSYDGGRLVLQGKVAERTVVDRIQKYLDTYVICGECGRPDTHLVKEERTTVVKCDACGGHRPVKAAKRQAAQKPADAVEEGKQYEVMIEDMGKRGDGIAHRERYTIYVPGVQKGMVVKVKITKVTGTLAFAELVRE